ncbi:hypothetical protein [Faecalicatena contorta]|uniref:hypothetical protein n=1 Tax=Faecalicatena contorta TaxID=39482 RepID=UPI001F2BFE42|nr:hypothetical protein [Faecalicatena contorta]MCF2554577.1 hypothetical protein [Faecalicatena contorta]MCF2679509.1 hypothetical protein [Faecalicatena contorta]
MSNRKPETIAEYGQISFVTAAEYDIVISQTDCYNDINIILEQKVSYQEFKEHAKSIFL